MILVEEKMGATAVDEVGEGGEVGAMDGPATPLDCNFWISSFTFAISSAADCNLCSSWRIRAAVESMETAVDDDEDELLPIFWRLAGGEREFFEVDIKIRRNEKMMDDQTNDFGDSCRFFEATFLK